VQYYLQANVSWNERRVKVITHLPLISRASHSHALNAAYGGAPLKFNSFLPS